MMATACGDDDASTSSPSPEATDEASARPTVAEVAADESDDGAWQAVVSAAGDEGEVVVYGTAAPAFFARLESAFEAAYPEVDLTYINSLAPEMETRVRTELEAGRIGADAMLGAGQALFEELDSSGEFARVSGPSLEGLDERFRLSDSLTFTFSDGYGWAWNSEGWPAGVTNWDDFLSPELRGRIGVMEPTTEAIASNWAYMEQEAGEAFLDALGEQDVRIYPGTAAIVGALTSGEIDVATFSAAAPIYEQQAQGAPLEFLPPPGNVWSAFYYTGVFADASHPNAGQLFVDFLVSSAGQTALGKGVVPVLPGIEGALVAPDRAVQRQTLSPDETSEIQAEFDERFR